MSKEDSAIKYVYLQDIRAKKTKPKGRSSGIKFGQKFHKNSGIYTKDINKQYKAV